jgi:hypothetical protein
MLHPALALTLAAARTEAVERATARTRTIRLARSVVHERRVPATSFAGQLFASTQPRRGRSTPRPTA